VRSATHSAVLVLAWTASAFWVWHYVDRGWWPNNGGAFGLSAERVLAGELPHRDFDEIYTGGVSFLNALAFKVLGTSMTAMRRVLFVFFLAWIPSVYWIATRFAGALVAGLMTLLAAGWSMCIYTEPIANWYNLFFATFGLASLLRWFETGRRRWLAVVGACAGLSILAKIVGIFFLIAACATVLFTEQTANRQKPAPDDGRRSAPATAYRVGIALALCAGVFLLGAIVFRWHGTAGLLHFVLPNALLAAVLVRNEIAGPAGSATTRFREHVRLMAPVVLGLAAVVLPFLVPYAMTGSLGDLVNGLFVAPRKRLDVMVIPPPMFSWASLPVLAMLAWVPRWPRRPAWLLAGALAVAGVAWIVGRDPNEVEPPLVESLRAIAPAAVVAGTLPLIFRRTRDDLRSAPVFASLAVTGFCSLVQFPVAMPIYFCFVIPLALLAALAVFDERRSAARASLVVAILTYLVLAISAVEHIHEEDVAKLDVDRAGGILVKPGDAKQYRELVELVRSLAGGDAIYATPDCPEVYFLSGSRSPTRTSYDFFDEPEGRVRRIEESLVRNGVRVVVLNRLPQFSGPPPAELLARLAEAYPQTAVVGNFEVRWKP
jgi:Dolichyl-phosphate-mannose-protein mannosyltransferase